MTALQPKPALNRKPYVAGQFYPGDPGSLRREIASHLSRASGPTRAARGIVVPHAGYMYSGSVAGAVYGTAGLPRRLVLLGPNHTGLGRALALASRGAWETPLGMARIDEALADLILDATNIVEEDDAAHHAEHSLEVQIPFLQEVLGDFQFVPICVGTGRFSELATLGAAVGAAIQTLGEPVCIVMSTDMSHYEPAAVAKEKDHKAIGRIQALDAEGLHAVVRREEISMCGYAATTAGLHALARLGADHADLIAYANSGEVSGDLHEVVGYAGLLIP